jgi:hypothetical protein
VRGTARRGGRSAVPSVIRTRLLARAKLSRADGGGTDGPCDALTRRCETFDVMAAVTTAIARRAMTPRTRRITIRFGAAAAALEPEAHSAPPCRAGVGPQCMATPGHLPATAEVMPLPRGELEETGEQDDHSNRDRYSARQRRLLHLDRRQRDAHGVDLLAILVKVAQPCLSPWLYSSWRRHQTPVSLRPLGARSSHWYMPQRTSTPRE